MRRYLLALLICGCGGGEGTVSSALAKKCQDSCAAHTAKMCFGASCGQCSIVVPMFEHVGCATPWGAFFDCVTGAVDVCMPDECADELDAASACVDSFCTTHPSDAACQQADAG